MKPHLRADTSPIAHPDNVVVGDTWRVTVLDAGLFRVEFDPQGQFEDRASQFAWFRDGEPVPFERIDGPQAVEIATERAQLVFDRADFSASGLRVKLRGTYSGWRDSWHYGDGAPGLPGTMRTLDQIDGETPLGPSVLSHKAGIAAYDDSGTILLGEDGWIAPRRPGTRDLYIFAYGTDYRAALRAFYRVSGPQPLLPRFALGTWWSRYHRYTAEEYLQVIDDLTAYGVPLSVAVIDMDWHIVDIPAGLGSGWTGYTWNRDLFPDPAGFLEALHERGLKVTLNVHPADGVRRHEEAYERMARRLGVDPASGQGLLFDATDPEFVEAYLEEVHHPLEEEGVDFWWLDWQQGTTTRMPGLDPLWVLNHFHFLDSARPGAAGLNRPMTFSRYAELGSHRYPIGFSGDAVISWASLDFQPYVTAYAANVGYGWWSHDIGGHERGVKDHELATRWVQLGVFSPILRLHSTASPFNGKEPWKYGEAGPVMRDWLAFRHRLVPYLYSMMVRATDDGVPLVSPLYYDYPQQPQAYELRNVFMFGTSLLVAPITAPGDAGLGLGTSTAWLPPVGGWCDILTGQVYGAGQVRVYRPLDGYPVLAPAGAVIPLAGQGRLPGEASRGPRTSGEVPFVSAAPVPTDIDVLIVAGGDGAFTLVEDLDDSGDFARTSITYADGVLTVHPVTGAAGVVPTRNYRVVLCGFGELEGARGGDGQPIPLEEHEDGPHRWTVALPDVDPDHGVEVHLHGDLRLTAYPITHERTRARIFALLDRVETSIPAKEAAWQACLSAQTNAEAVLGLESLDLHPDLRGALVEILLGGG